MPHCATMLRSLLDNHGSAAHVHFLPGDDVDAELIEPLAGMVTGMGAELSVHRCSSGRLGELADHAFPTVWYRLYLPELLPAVDRVIYLDSDLIVQDSLEELWSTDLSGQCLAAVTSVFHSGEWGDRHCAALGLSEREQSFNAGVVLMDLGRLRREDAVSRLHDYALANVDRRWRSEVDGSPEAHARYILDHPERLLFWEQDCLNAVLADRRVPLHPRWNVMHQILFPWAQEVYGPASSAEALEQPAVRHFEGVGDKKPWSPGATSAMQHLYWTYRQRTPWAAHAEEASFSP